MGKANQPERRRTTIFVNPLIHKELHVAAIRLDRSIAECLEESILDFVKKYEKEIEKNQFQKK